MAVIKTKQKKTWMSIGLIVSESITFLPLVKEVFGQL